MKGKETLTEKISKSDITEWKEQKYHKLAFFKAISTTFKTGDEVKICGNNLAEASNEFKKHILESTEDSLEYKELDNETKKELVNLEIKLLSIILKMVLQFMKPVKN